MGEERGVYRVLVGKPEGRRPLLPISSAINCELQGDSPGSGNIVDKFLDT